VARGDSASSGQCADNESMRIRGLARVIDRSIDRQYVRERSAAGLLIVAARDPRERIAPRAAYA